MKGPVLESLGEQKQGRVSGLLDVLSVGSLANFRGGASTEKGSAVPDSNAIDAASPRVSGQQSIMHMKGRLSKLSLVMRGDADSSSDDSGWDSA